MLPKLKKRISSFVLEESGKISKSSLVKIGSVLLVSAFASSQPVLGGCGCSCLAPPDPPPATCTPGSCASGGCGSCASDPGGCGCGCSCG